MVVVPEGGGIGGELDKYLDVTNHLEHVDHLSLPGRQLGLERHQVRLQDADTEGHNNPLGPEYLGLASLCVLGHNLDGVFTRFPVSHLGKVMIIVDHQ